MHGCLPYVSTRLLVERFVCNSVSKALSCIVRCIECTDYADAYHTSRSIAVCLNSSVVWIGIDGI